jgi:hypothetical protein
VLTESEIRTVWYALDDLPPRFASAIKITLLTAQRRGEVLGMTWQELDLDAGWWTIPAERAKNGLAHRVPLVGTTLALLSAMHAAQHDSIFVFPGVQPGKPVVSIEKPFRRLMKVAGVTFHVHDLRRSAASHMTGMGIQRLVVKMILNHVDRDITAVYDRHSYDQEKRAALLKWDRHLADIIAKEPVSTGNVLELRAWTVAIAPKKGSLLTQYLSPKQLREGRKESRRTWRLLRELDDIEADCNTAELRELYEEERDARQLGDGLQLDDRIGYIALIYVLLIGDEGMPGKIAETRRKLKRGDLVADEVVLEIEKLHRGLTALLRNERRIGLGQVMGGYHTPHEKRADCLRFLEDQKMRGVELRVMVKDAVKRFEIDRTQVYRYFRKYVKTPL